MQQAVGAMLLIVWLPLLAAAQRSDESRGHGYFYFAPGVSSPDGTAMAHVGGGAEGFFTKNLGAGVDVGYLTLMRRWNDGIGTFSPNFIARFLPKQDNKIEPFFTGGYTLFFRSGTANGFNFGGGANWWFKHHLGLCLEIRDNVMVEEGTGHFIGFRIGLALR